MRYIQKHISSSHHCLRHQNTGGSPATWYLRWDAPSSEQAAVTEFFISGPQEIAVSTAPSMRGPWTYVPVRSLLQAARFDVKTFSFSHLFSPLALQKS